MEREELALEAWSGFGDHPNELPAPVDGLYSMALRTGTAGVAGSRSKSSTAITSETRVFEWMARTSCASQLRSATVDQLVQVRLPR